MLTFNVNTDYAYTGIRHDPTGTHLASLKSGIENLVHSSDMGCLAYIRLVINPRDDEAFKRIVNYPTRGIGDTTVQRIAQLAAEPVSYTHLSWYSSTRMYLNSSW